MEALPTTCNGNHLTRCWDAKKHALCSCAGDNCSVDESLAHWSALEASLNMSRSMLARASHSAVLWQGSMLVYGGYRFPPNGYTYFDAEGIDGEMEPEGDLLRYSLESDSWEVVSTSATTYSLEDPGSNSGSGSGSGLGSGSGSGSGASVRVPRLPSPRYGHSAVVYGVSGIDAVPPVC